MRRRRSVAPRETGVRVAKAQATPSTERHEPRGTEPPHPRPNAGSPRRRRSARRPDDQPSRAGVRRHPQACHRAATTFLSDEAACAWFPIRWQWRDGGRNRQRLLAWRRDPRRLDWRLRQSSRQDRGDLWPERQPIERALGAGRPSRRGGGAGSRRCPTRRASLSPTTRLRPASPTTFKRSPAPFARAARMS